MEAKKFSEVEEEEKGWRRVGGGGEGGPNSSCSSSHKERTGKGFCPECRLLNHCHESRVNYPIKHIQKASKRKPSNTTLHISSSNPMRAEFSDF